MNAFFDLVAVSTSYSAAVIIPASVVSLFLKREAASRPLAALSFASYYPSIGLVLGWLAPGTIGGPCGTPAANHTTISIAWALSMWMLSLFAKAKGLKDPSARYALCGTLPLLTTALAWYG